MLAEFVDFGAYPQPEWNNRKSAQELLRCLEDYSKLFSEQAN